MKRKIVFVIPVSRLDYLWVFETIGFGRVAVKLDFDYRFYIIGDGLFSFEQIKISNVFGMIAKQNRCKGVQFLWRGDVKPPHNSHMRRKRIEKNLKIAQSAVRDEETMVMIEDDTNFTEKDLERLVVGYLEKNHRHEVGMYSGLQVGRWRYRILGAWDLAKGSYIVPQEIESIKIDSLGKDVEVDATGLYFFVMSGRIFRQIEIKEKEGLAPDVALGFSLRERGYKNFVNPEISVGHLTEKGDLTVFNEKCVKILMRKRRNVWSVVDIQKLYIGL